MSDTDISAAASFLFLAGRLSGTLRNSSNAPLLQASLICLPTHYQTVSDGFVATERKDAGLATGRENRGGNNRDSQMLIYFL